MDIVIHEINKLYSIFNLIIYYSTSRTGAKYCKIHVCLCVSLCECIFPKFQNYQHYTQRIVQDMNHRFLKVLQLISHTFKNEEESCYGSS